MLGDTAVAVHPKDSRYQKLVGQKVLLPLVNRKIPIIADDKVDQSFGTGAIKVTPAHDPLDAEIGDTHQLPIINVIGEDGLMTKEAGDFAGLAVKQARADIVAALTKTKTLIETKSHTHPVTLCDRCDTPIEPLISR
jgi:valyl-tRNA synthetase